MQGSPAQMLPNSKTPSTQKKGGPPKKPSEIPVQKRIASHLPGPQDPVGDVVRCARRNHTSGAGVRGCSDCRTVPRLPGAFNRALPLLFPTFPTRSDELIHLAVSPLSSTDSDSYAALIGRNKLESNFAYRLSRGSLSERISMLLQPRAGCDGRSKLGLSMTSARIVVSPLARPNSFGVFHQ